MSKLYVLSGPSGVGKDTVLGRITGEANIKKTVSVTTRQPRQGEVDGTHYHFVTKEKFDDMVKDNEFLEYAKVHDNYYGTRISEVNETLDAGNDLILAIDVQGGVSIKKIMPEAVLVFLLPPSFEELANRLSSRGTESEDSLKIRLENAKRELGFADSYDYNIVNDTVENAGKKLKEIIENGR